jgi:hypothetical protein
MTQSRRLPIIIASLLFLFAASPGLQGAPVMNADVARLLEAGMSEQVILQTIAVGQPDFDLGPDALIVLKNKGATPAILSAMLATAQPAAQPSGASAAPLPPLPTDVMATSVEVPAGPSPAATSPVPADDVVTAPPSVEPAQVSLAYFQGQLAPYGGWVELPGYGLCWQPMVGAQNAAWRPYCDGGHWTYTDQGWYWESDYPWGDVVFHYGRWARASGYGWVWVPDYFWGPSWVSWRYAESEGCIGWAPLPPGAQLVVGFGLRWRGGYAVDADFGLGAADFCFVGYGDFWDRDFRGRFFGRERAERVWRGSVVRNGYRFTNGRMFVDGPGSQRVGLLTQRQVRPVAVRELSGREQHDHFVARQKDVVRNVEVRRELAKRDNVRRVPIPQGQSQHPDVRGGDTQRERVVPQRNENVRATPPQGISPRVEPPRQTPGGSYSSQRRLPPTRPSAQTPVRSQPAQKTASGQDEKGKTNSKAKPQ